MPVPEIRSKLAAILEEDRAQALDAAVLALDASLLEFETWAETHRREQNEAQKRIWNDTDPQAAGA